MGQKSMTSFLVYVIKRLSTVCYVGVSTNVARRWREHKRKAATGSFAISLAIRKHGIDSFEMEEVLVGLTWEQACEAERALIALFGTMCDGVKSFAYNMTEGGDLRHGVIPETREKISKSMTGVKKSVYHNAANAASRIGRKASPETRAKMAASRANVSDETRSKLRTSMTGRKMPREAVEKMAAKNRGRKHSEEARRNMSASHIGKRHLPEAYEKTAAKNRGRKHSDVARANMRAAAIAREESKRLAQSRSNFTSR
jgi:group I intron endonuclease